MVEWELPLWKVFLSYLILFISGSNATASDNGLYRLSCRKQNDLWFDLMDQYGDLGTTLSIISLAGLVLYYITSSDSCSLVVAYLTSNGDEGPTFLQRTFWGLTEGACATALLKAGGLAAFQIAAIIAGLPFTFIHNFVCVALWRAVRDVPDEEIREERERNIPHERKGFAIELLDMLYKPNKK